MLYKLLTYLFYFAFILNGNNVYKGQSNLALGDITENMLFVGRGTCMGSSVVLLDRVLLSSYRLSKCL